MKKLIVKKVKRVLDNHEYEYVEYEGGAFDIAARGEKSFLLKVLSNIDSMLPFQANNLKSLSYNLDSSPFLIGMRANKGSLDDGVLFERFGLPAVTVGTFEDMMDGEYPLFKRLKGGLFGEVDSDALKSAREKNNLSQSQLGERLHVSKKTVYQHERGRGLASVEFIKNAERELDGKITRKVTVKVDLEFTESKPKSIEEVEVSNTLRNMGFETSFVEKAPFDIVAKRKDSMLSEVMVEDTDDKRVDTLKEMSNLFNKRFFLVGDEEDLNAPVVSREELSEFHNPREFLKSLDKKMRRL